MQLWKIVALWSSFLIASSDCVLAGGPVAARTAVTPAVFVTANLTCLRARSSTASPVASTSLATPRLRSPPSTLHSSPNPPTSSRSMTARRRTRPMRSTTTALATTTTTTTTATAARWWRPSTCLTTRPLPRLTSSSPRGCSVRTARCTRVSQVSTGRTQSTRAPPNCAHARGAIQPPQRWSVFRPEPLYTHSTPRLVAPPDNQNPSSFARVTCWVKTRRKRKLSQSKLGTKCVWYLHLQIYYY